jgi:hypothetical protein
VYPKLDPNSAKLEQMLFHGTLQFPPRILALLWSIQMQTRFGDHQPDVHKETFFQ